MRQTRKYKNTKVEHVLPDGTVLTFDSKKELARYCELALLQKAGRISGLAMQQKYELIPAIRRPDGKLERACTYVADFVYTDEDGETVVEDVKGYRDPASAAYAKFVIKRKLMLQRYGICIKEV